MKPPYMSHLYSFTLLSAGTLPSGFGNLSKLVAVTIGNSRLSGELSALRNFSALRYLHFSYNQLSGSLSNELLSHSPNLFSALFFANRLSGTVSRALFFINDSHTGAVGSRRSLLTQTTTSAFDSVERVNYLAFGANAFSGTIGETLCDFNNLQGVTLDNNMLSGSLHSW